ncbi:MAG: phosphoesterase [Pirellulaceae bacterium]
MSEEHVLVIPEERLNAIGRFSGFRAFSEEAFATLLDPSYMEFRPRSTVEEDPTFKQLIPYAVLRVDPATPSVFQYTRGKGQGEKRLHALKSIGIGGHISKEDADGEDLYRSGMQRELTEEMVIDSAYQDQMVGFIYDDSTPVGRVHLGIIHLLTLESTDARARETELVESGFESVESMKQELDRFETWSQLCLNHLF